jgi:hypothetical protein
LHKEHVMASEEPTLPFRAPQLRNKVGQFAGVAATCPVGTVRIRTRHKRRGDRRAYVKVAEPGVWVLRARVVWEQAHGPIPRNVGIHHKDRNTLNDALENLELMNKSQHVNEHRAEWEAKRIAAVRKANTGRTWSTKSKEKFTGRPPDFDREAMAKAVAAYQAGEGTLASVAARHGVKWEALGHQVRKGKNKP